jgi:hypothetical protein
MKKILTATITSAFALVLMSTNVAAQNNHLVAAAKTTNKEVSNDPAELERRATEAPSVAISAKVTRAFNKSFTDVTPKWFMVDDKFLARFNDKDGLTHALYHKNGFQYYSVTKGSPKMLPATVHQMLEEYYPDYSIETATKIVSMGATAWTADLKLNNKLLIVKVIDNEIVEAVLYQNKIK